MLNQPLVPITGVLSAANITALGAKDVRTLGQLLSVDKHANYNKLKIVDIQTKVRNLYNIPINIVSHSWHGLICHALIPNTKSTSKLVRARVESVLMYPNRIAISLTYKGGKVERSLIMTQEINRRWVNCEVLSDSEENDLEEACTLPRFSYTSGEEIASLTSSCHDRLRVAQWEANSLQDMVIQDT